MKRVHAGRARCARSVAYVRQRRPCPYARGGSCPVVVFPPTFPAHPARGGGGGHRRRRAVLCCERVPWSATSTCTTSHMSVPLSPLPRGEGKEDEEERGGGGGGRGRGARRRGWRPLPKRRPRWAARARRAAAALSVRSLGLGLGLALGWRGGGRGPVGRLLGGGLAQLVQEPAVPPGPPAPLLCARRPAVSDAERVMQRASSTRARTTAS